MTGTSGQGGIEGLGPIHSRLGEYHVAFSAEASREVWDGMDIMQRMSFAGVYGVLTERQAAAAEAAIEANRDTDDPLPPLGVVFWAEEFLKDETWRPDLVDETAS